jgi:hypothetical protein
MLGKLLDPASLAVRSAAVQFLVGARIEKRGTCGKSAQIGTGFALTVAQGEA